MPRRRKGEPPKLCRHKASGQGYVTIEKKRIYLGTFGTAECRRRYRAELQRWEEEQRKIVVSRGSTYYLDRSATVRELVREFMARVADTRYQIDGERTSTWQCCRLYLVDGLAARFGDYLTDEFRHPEFEEFRRAYIQRGYSRNSMKILTARILVLFRWAHKQGVVSAETLTSIETSPDSDEGEERDPVEHVDPGTFDALVASLGKPWKRDYKAVRSRLAAMIQIQYLVGMRPGELVRMKRQEIRQDATVVVRGKVVQITDDAGQPYRGWCFQPSRFKTMKKGRYLAYLVGPRARALLQPYLPEESEGYVWPGQGERGHLTINGYRAMVYAACERAGLESIAVNQLRHSAATRYGLIAGLEKASQVLSHASLDTTAVYFSRSLQGVTGLVEEHG